MAVKLEFGLGVVAFLVACGTTDPSALRDMSPLTFLIFEFDGPITLSVRTESQFRCSDYKLEGSFKTSGDRLEVAFTGRVMPPETCVHSPAPAYYNVPLPVQTGGTYPLEFTRAGVTDRYTLTVSDTTFEITTQEASFTQPLVKTIVRTQSGP